jgi:tripartite-type tricarboxylate transporter receptor subunit TctC
MFGGNFLFGVCTALVAYSINAQSVFPEKPIRVITPFAAGNTLDTALRIVSDEIKKQTGQVLVIENRPGGSGFIAAQAVAQATADGYTLLLASSSILTVNPHTFKSLPYDSERSFRPITNFLGTSMVMAANMQAPGATLQ